jgi:beta-lactamase class C
MRRKAGERSSNQAIWRWASVIVAAFFACLFPVLATPQFITPQSIAKNDMDSKVESIVVREIEPLVSVQGAGGVAVAVRIDGHSLFFNEGLADQATQRPITPDSLFNVASVRKLFEATLVAQGVLRGELTLDDPVNKYVKELQGDYIRRVTIGQLASHTSGLLLPTDHPPWPNESYSLGEFLAILNAWTPQHGEEPGQQRIYTHAGYVLLQLALERRYHMPIGELIRERILKPLKMDSTLVPERGPDNQAIMSPQFMQRAVQGYGVDGTAIGAPGNQQSYYDFPGTGQMFSSARDLATFVAAFLGEMPTDPQLKQALQETEREAFRVNDQYGQAMAWEINKAWEINGTGEDAIVDKPGGMNNASAYVGLVPERKIGLVILSNRGDVYPHEVARGKILPELVKLGAAE